VGRYAGRWILDLDTRRRYLTSISGCVQTPDPAREVIEQVMDDLDASLAAETVSFGRRGSPSRSISTTGTATSAAPYQFNGSQPGDRPANAPVLNLDGRPAGRAVTSVGMDQRVVFGEPACPRTMLLAATEPRVNWFLKCSRPEAANGRRVVNDLYSRFPDPEGRLRDRLRSTKEADLVAALDELLVHDHLQRRYRVTTRTAGRRGQARTSGCTTATAPTSALSRFSRC
jgi:hypothetical protein